MFYRLLTKNSAASSRRFCMLFFDVLPFTDDACVVNGKTSKKSVQNQRDGFWCAKAFIMIILFRHRGNTGDLRLFHL